MMFQGNLKPNKNKITLKVQAAKDSFKITKNVIIMKIDNNSCNNKG